MNAIINKLLLAGDKFMPEGRFTDPVLTYSACESFTKNKKIIKNFKDIFKIQNLSKLIR